MQDPAEQSRVARRDFVDAETVHRPDGRTAVRIVGDPVADPTPATRKLYAADWAHFVRWCREHRRDALPASCETMADYLLAMAPSLSRGALGRRRAAIGTTHRQAGLPIPLLPPASHKALRIAAKPQTPSGSSRQPTASSLVRMAQVCPRDLPGLRDRALLLLAAATARPQARRRNQTEPAQEVDAVGHTVVARLFLLALDAEDVRFTVAGMALQVRTRTDEAIPSRSVTFIRAKTPNACPVRALEEWLRTSETGFGPVFRKVDRWGNVEHGRLAPDAWHRILARRRTPQHRATPTAGNP